MLHPGCRVERLQGVKCTPERERIQFRFVRKVIERGGTFKPFKRDVSLKRGKEVIGLGRDRMGWRPFQRSILLQ